VSSCKATASNILRREGSTFHVLDRFAGLPVARPHGNLAAKAKGYKHAVAALAKAMLGGYDLLDARMDPADPVFDHNKPLVDALPGGDQDKASCWSWSYTREGDEITQEIRKRLKAERSSARGKDLPDASRSAGRKRARRLARYEGNEVIQFVRNSGQYRAGQRSPLRVPPEAAEARTFCRLCAMRSNWPKATPSGSPPMP